MNFDTPINIISGVGQYYQAKLEKLGIKTVRDLFFHFPKRYEDFSNFKNIEDIEIGEIATITGKIADIKTIRTWKRKMFMTLSANNSPLFLRIALSKHKPIKP